MALDGLRAFALLIIMGYHFGVDRFQGGFFSLDIFYVLSGYLITGLLLGEWARSARIRLGAFWLRRARRLLPALCVVLVVVTLVIRFTYPAGLYPNLRMADLSALFYFSNWWQIAACGNYFVATGAVSPLTHTWSLAVEEQFYLVWPLVVLAVLHVARAIHRHRVRERRGTESSGTDADDAAADGCARPGHRSGGRGAVGHLGRRGGGLGARRWHGSITPGSTSPASTSAPTPTPSPSWWARCWPARSPSSSATGDWRHGPGGHGPWLPGGPHRAGPGRPGRHHRPHHHLVGHQCPRLPGWVPPVGPVGRRPHHRGGVRGRGPIAKVLSVRPLVWMGTVSYGAYLWHFPVAIELDSARTGLGGAGLLAVRVARHLRPGRRQLLPGRAPGHGGRVLALPQGRRTGPRRHGCHRGRGDGGHGGAGGGGGGRAPVPGKLQTVRPPEIVVLGDSTALTLGYALAATAPPGTRVVNGGLYGCGLAIGSWVSNDPPTPQLAMFPACNEATPADGQWPALDAAGVAGTAPR